jgi:hypothetical protein
MPSPSAEYLSLPFSEAIGFFRDKVSLPTERWDDLWQGMHSRGFVVAGATKSELLADLRQAVDKAISQGTSLAEFRKDFDNIVAKHGWQYKGDRGWRTAVIYDTNLSVAYSAGHYAAATAPAVLAVRPWWQYLPSSSFHRREEHVQWYGIVLRHDDPWWATHYPPNGWGCKCGVTTMSDREYQQAKGTLRTEAPDDGTYDYVDKQTGEVSQVPKGIDPGWDYNPGQAAWGKKLSDSAMAEYKALAANAWESLTPGNWKTNGLAEQLLPIAPRAKLGPQLQTPAEATAALTQILGGPENIYSFESKGFRYDILANAEALGSHISVDRSPFLPFIPEVLTDPQEVWQRFEQHKGTGKVVLRQRIIKVVGLEKEKTVLVVAEARDGFIEAWTMLPVSSGPYLNKQRSGELIYSREQMD